MTRRTIVSLLAVAAALSPAAAQNAKPEYKQVKAELCRSRGGLPNFFAKCAAGGEIRIGYLGGSITAQNGWRPKTLKWFQDRYPKAKFSEINAAIGGTGSDLGVFRVGQDVLRHKPDMLFVEFAVNDGGASPEAIWRGMEGIVRQTWRANPNTDVCFVYTLHTGMKGDYEKGMCPRSASAMELLADYYGIPSMNMALRIVQLAQEGKLLYKPEKDADGKTVPTPGKIVFANDDCHPLDAGHEVYRDVIGAGMEKIEKLGRPAPHELKAPFVADNLERATIVPLKPSMLSAGWTKLPTDKGLGRAFGHRMGDLWEATKPGEKIEFKFRGTTVRLYDLLGPDGANVVCTVDGKAGKPRPRFDHYCTYHRIATLSIADNLPNGEHTVCVEIQKDQPDRSSVVNREKDKKGFDPKRFDGTAMRVGGIMLVGEIVE